MKDQGRAPRRLVTDKLRSYAAAHRTVMPSVVHSTQPTRTTERRSRISRRGNARARCAGFKRVGHALRFSSVHGPVQDLFSGRPTLAALGSSPPASNPGIRRVGCGGDLRRLSGRGPLEAGKRAGLVKLTVPSLGLDVDRFRNFVTGALHDSKVKLVVQDEVEPDLPSAT